CPDSVDAAGIIDGADGPGGTAPTGTKPRASSISADPVLTHAGVPRGDSSRTRSSLHSIPSSGTPASNWARGVSAWAS
ncbi:MAG: hypothetical protein MPK62_05030, partial [Alphaproteobacteria bacterium]|nr:hypothetical protein [Alphaproteobacteria bacterium]